MNIFVLLYNSGTENEGIHSIELKGRTIVLMFEVKDDAERYCGLLEAQDFPLPTVEMIDINEIRDFCNKLHKQGHTWILSNSDVKGWIEDGDFFDKLYADYTILRVLARRSINSKSDRRGELNELLITNVNDF